MTHLLFWLIIAFVAGGYLLNLILNYLNLSNHSDHLPERLKDFYDEEKYQRSQQYDRAKTKLSLLTSTVGTILIILIIAFGGFAVLDEWARSISQHFIWMPLLFFGIIYLASDLFGLPVALYDTFVIEEKYGFNRTSPKTFIIDKVKGYLLTILLGGGILALIIWFYHWAGGLFWLYALIAVSVISIFFAMFYTSLIVPLFNKLSPLTKADLREAIENYTAKVNFSLKNIFVIDGSKRSTKSNAYFSGLGPKKSIVLFDTLTEKHTNEELVAVLAHEVGHYKKKHIYKGIGLSVLQTGIMFYLLGFLVGQPALSAALGAEVHSFHMGLLAFGLLYAPVSLFTGMAMNAFSRKNEYEADAFAARTYDAAALQSALKKLSVENLSNLEPHPAYVFVHYSHPPVLSRLRALDAFRDSG